jgi:hypothetical protein
VSKRLLLLSIMMVGLLAAGITSLTMYRPNAPRIGKF